MTQNLEEGFELEWIYVVWVPRRSLSERERERERKKERIERNTCSEYIRKERMHEKYMSM